MMPNAHFTKSYLTIDIIERSYECSTEAYGLTSKLDKGEWENFITVVGSSIFATEI